MLIAVAILSAVASVGAAIAAFRLVGITRRYTEHTQRMVEEMQRARLAAIEPRLIPVVEYGPEQRGVVSVQNIGPGPAFDLELVLIFEPGGTTFRIRRYLLPSPR